MVENREIFVPNLYLARSQWVTPSEFRENIWCDKTRMIGLYRLVEKNCDNNVKPFSLSERNGQTDGRTDRRSDRQTCYTNVARQYADAR